MSGRDNRSARVVIMDDISWSEPTPRDRKATPQLEPPEWMQPPEARFVPRDAVDPSVNRRVSDDVPRRAAESRRREQSARDEEPLNGYRVDDYLDDDLGETVGRWRAELAPEPPVIEYVGDVGDIDEETIWGPRPKLMADQPSGRRTVVITGRGAERHVAPRSSARGGVPAHARHGFAADRTAMWAVLLCVILLLVAVTSH